jgi:hypothetical protein
LASPISIACAAIIDKVDRLVLKTMAKSDKVDPLVLKTMAKPDKVDPLVLKTMAKRRRRKYQPVTP